MSAAADRREFLRAAGHFALGMSVLDPESLHATSPPPRVPAGTGLKTIEGEGLMPLPAGAKGRLGSPRMRVPGHVNAIQFAPRGHTLVAASGSEIRAWDPRTGKVLFRLGYPQNASISGGRLTSVDSFALLVQPDTGGKFEIRHYAFGNGKSLSESPPLDLGQAQHTAFSMDGSLVAVVRQEALHVYDAKGTEKWKEPLPPAAVGGCCFFADGATLALATKGEVRLFAVATGKVTSTLQVGDVAAGNDLNHESDWTANLVISADGKWLAAAVGQDGDSIFCWDVNAGKVQHRLKSDKPVGFTPDAAELFTYKGTTVTCWTLSTGAARTIEVPHDRDLALSPDGKILASSAGDAVMLVDATTGKHLPHSADPPGLPTVLRFGRVDRLVGLVAGWGGWVEWDVAAGTSRLLRPPGVSGLTPVALSDDGRLALYRQKTEYSTRDMATGKTLVTAKQAENVNESSLGAGMTPDGRSIIAPIPEGLAVTTEKERKVVRGGAGDTDGNVSAIATSADGRWAAIAFRNSEHHAIDLYDLHAGQFARRLSAKGDVSQLTFAPDSHWLAAGQDIEWRQPPGGNDQRAVTVYDPHTGRAVLQITLEAYHEAVIALSPGGRMLARLEGTRDSEYKIAIWEVLGNSVRARFDIGGALSAMAFASDGRTLAASIYGGPVFLWDLHAPPRDTGPPTAAELDRAWTDLRAADAAKAFEAIKLLTRNPGAAVPLLREKITPVVPPDPRQVRQLIDDLDHKDYRRRETAMRGLADLGERVRAPLKQSLTPGQTPEVRERIERLLAAEERPTPDYLRRVRAVEAMEVSGTKEARELLTHWAGGAPGALFTRDAEAAVKRLAVRKEN